MKPLRLSFCTTLIAALCGTAASLVASEAVLSRTFVQDVAADFLAPEALVRQVAAGMLDAAGGARSEGSQEALRFAEEKLIGHVDFTDAARSAAGEAWTHATAAQQAQLVAAFRLVMVRGQLEALQAHGGRTLAVLAPPTVMRGAENITVQSRLDAREGAPLHVEYALRRRGGEWKIYDIRVDGESLVDACRPLFEKVARAEGIAGLIKRMNGNTRSRPVVWA